MMARNALLAALFALQVATLATALPTSTSAATVTLPTAGRMAAATALPQTSGADAIAAARRYREANEHRILGELIELLRIPNVAGDGPGIRANAQWLLRAMEARGMNARLLETDGPPYVFGELSIPGAERTLLFYCHYDGQPADPSQWIGHQPWQPVFRNGRLEDGGEIISTPTGAIDENWRIYARSASDDRSPIVMLFAALDALRDAGISPAANIKFIFEGDEEAGSPNMNAVAERFATELERLLEEGLRGGEILHDAHQDSQIVDVRSHLRVTLAQQAPAQGERLAEHRFGGFVVPELGQGDRLVVELTGQTQAAAR